MLDRSTVYAEAWFVAFFCNCHGSSLGEFPCDDERDVDLRLSAYLREAGCRVREVSGAADDENLKIGTVLHGLRSELKKHILIGLSLTTICADIRVQMLEWERSTQSWNAENILQSFSMAAWKESKKDML